MCNIENPENQDDRFADRIRKDDPVVFQDILERLGPSVEFYITSKFPTLRNDAEDIVSEALLRLWKYRDNLKGLIGGYFMTTAVRLAVDRLRRFHPDEVHFIAGQHVFPEISAKQEGSDTTTLDDRTGDSKLERDYREILGMLPQRDQDIWEAGLFRVGERWTAEIEDKYGMKPGTIRVRYRRIREKIRTELEGRGHNPPELQ